MKQKNIQEVNYGRRCITKNQYDIIHYERNKVKERMHRIQ